MTSTDLGAGLGAELVAARAETPPVPWKTLVARHRRSRGWLARIYAEELARRKDPDAAVGAAIAETRALLAKAACLLDRAETLHQCGVSKKDV